MAIKTPHLFLLFASLTAYSPAQNDALDPTTKDIQALCPGDAKAQAACLETLERRIDQTSERMSTVSGGYAALAYNQGRDFMEKGAVDKAQQAFKDAVDLQPNFIDARIGLGAACYELNDLTCAVRELETAQALSKTQKIGEGTRSDLNTLKDILQKHQI